MIDVANLEWWQGLIAIAGALGLSPAPWILGLALGRIQFSGPAQKDHDARIADLKAQHVEAIAALVAHHAALVVVKDQAYLELKESRDGYKTATAIERERADKVTDALTEFGELGKLAVHALTALDEATKDSTP